MTPASYDLNPEEPKPKNPMISVTARVSLQDITKVARYLIGKGFLANSNAAVVNEAVRIVAKATKFDEWDSMQCATWLAKHGFRVSQYKFTSGDPDRDDLSVIDLELDDYFRDDTGGPSEAP